MLLELKRTFKGPKYTVGHLYIDGKYFCDTLEDVDRGLDHFMNVAEINRIKVPKETAIPTGIYPVTITFSPRFKKYLPLLNYVRGFSGIRIHAGNTILNTEGCILVGENKIKGLVINSRKTLEKLIPIILEELYKNNPVDISIF